MRFDLILCPLLTLAVAMWLAWCAGYVERRWGE